MEKTKLEFKPVETVVFKFQGKDIVVKPYISYTEEIVFIINYLNTYFSKSEYYNSAYSVSESEYALVLEVIDTCTNIKIFDDDGSILVDIDTVMSTGLWDKIRENIANFYVFKNHLDDIISCIKYEQTLNSSFGKTFSKVPEMIVDFIEKVKPLIGDEVEIQKLKDILKDLEKEMLNSPLKELLVEPVNKRAKKAKQ